MGAIMLEKQVHVQATVEGDLREVWFLIEKDEDGYPESRTWEGMWARPIKDAFEILSVPFYLKNVSRGDVVDANQGDFLKFSDVRSRGGHNTYRLLMENGSHDEVETALTQLRSKALVVELNEAGILIAVDVPPSIDQQEIDAYLLSEKEAGRWQVQDGYLHNVRPS
jgi:Domain of unknown function (DUF4265)